MYTRYLTWYEYRKQYVSWVNFLAVGYRECGQHAFICICKCGYRCSFTWMVYGGPNPNPTPKSPFRASFSIVECVQRPHCRLHHRRFLYRQGPRGMCTQLKYNNVITNIPKATLLHVTESLWSCCDSRDPACPIFEAISLRDSARLQCCHSCPQSRITKTVTVESKPLISIYSSHWAPTFMVQYWTPDLVTIALEWWLHMPCRQAVSWEFWCQQIQ